MRFLSVLLLGAACVAAGCGRSADSPSMPSSNASGASAAPTLDMKELMGWVVDPNAAVVFAAVGTNVTKDGEEKIAPKNDAEWNKVRNSAAVVLESANLLMIGDRARDKDEWPKHVEEFAAATAKVMKAIDVKDTDEYFTASGDLYQACTDCHSKYIFSGAVKEK